MKLAISKEEAIQKLKSMGSRLSNYRAKAQESTEHAVGLALAACGGAGAGFLDARNYRIPGTDVEAHLGVGALAAAAAIFDFGGRYKDQLSDFAKGIAGYEAGKLASVYAVANK